MNDRGLKVLEQYDLEIISTRRGRGSYICETDRGLKLLCDFEGSEKKLVFQNRMLQELKEAGYENVDTVLENKEGKLVSQDRDENRYVLKDWFFGRECSSSGEEDIMDAVENLARLHLCMRFPEEEKQYCGIPLDKDLEAKTREMKKVRSFIRGRAETFCNEGKTEVQIAEGTLCHGDYNYHHVLFLDRGMATTNFGKCHFDFQVQDLYQFMRKILEKQNWDPQLGVRMLSAYERVRTLPPKEREFLYLRMAYPEKFWKLANHYYGSRKAWIPGRYLQKLETLCQQQEKRNSFLNLLE